MLAPNAQRCVLQLHLQLMQVKPCLSVLAHPAPTQLPFVKEVQTTVLLERCGQRRGRLREAGDRR